MIIHDLGGITSERDQNRPSGSAQVLKVFSDYENGD